ncbi:MAG: hypothetical protein RR364_01725 [Lachnospiraceae bacterium]
MSRLIIDGNSVYELDDECFKQQQLEDEKKMEEDHPDSSNCQYEGKNGRKGPLH